MLLSLYRLLSLTLERSLCGGGAESAYQTAMSRVAVQRLFVLKVDSDSFADYEQGTKTRGNSCLREAFTAPSSLGVPGASFARYVPP